MIAPPSSSGPAAFYFKAARQPMLWAALAYALGIMASTYAWRPALWWFGAAGGFLCAAAFFNTRRSGLAWLLALGGFFLAGAWQIGVRSGSNRLDTSIQPYSDRQELEVTAHVTHDARTREEFGEVRQSVDLMAEQIQTEDGTVIPTKSGIRLGIYSRRTEDAPPDVPVFRYGDRIRFRGKLRRPRNFRNPGAFGYEGYLADRGIVALGSSKLEDVELLPGFVGSRVESWRSHVHHSVIAKIHQLWQAREAALIDAMIIGDEAFIDRDTRVDFQRSGTYHVLVVSGMNVSILAFVIFWTLRRLRISEIPATVLTVGCCVGYAFITEVGAPVWRATLMCGVYLGTRLLYRERAMLNALGAAAFAVLIFDPRQLFTASFQMTFLCVLIVAGIGIPALERTSQLYKMALRNWDSSDYGALLPPKVAQLRLDLQMIAGRTARFIGESWGERMVRSTTHFVLAAFELVFVSAVMQMGLALPMAYYFHRATTVGLAANLVVVPMTQLMMPAAISALLLGYISPALAKLPALLTTLAVEGIAGTVRGLGGLRLADLRVAMPGALMIAMAALAVIFAITTARRHGVLAFAGLVAILLTSLDLALRRPAPPIRDKALEMTSIDVGEGDATLLIAPQGSTLLIDAGGPIGPGSSQLDYGEDVVSPYLWSRGLSRLDAVAITHGHSDHIGGMIAVLRNFRPKELWVGLLPPSRALEEVIFEAQSLGTKVVRHWEGDEFPFGGSNIEVLFPPRDWPLGAKPQNNDSLVLRVSYEETSALLEGDAEKMVERRIAALHHPSADLLKVGHHGSANATTPELIDAVKPEFAVISVGMGNTFGLPRMETLETLDQRRTRVYRTDLDGAVTFYLDGHSVKAAISGLQ